MSFDARHIPASAETALPGFLGLYNAVTNASRDDITQDALIALLCGDRGRPSQRRTLFSDVTWSQLAQFAAAAGIPKRQVFAAYELARVDVKAANPEIDEALATDRELGLYP